MGFKLLLGVVVISLCYIATAAYGYHHHHHEHPHYDEDYGSDEHSEEEIHSKEDDKEVHYGKEETHSKEDDKEVHYGKEYHKEESWNYHKEVLPKKIEKIPEKPLPTYEVTENVMDVPRPEEPPKGPVVTNIPVTRPLNTVIIVPPSNDTNRNFNTNINTNINTNVQTNVNNEEIKKVKTNYFSILHVKSEYDDLNAIPNVNIHKYPNFPGIRDYVHGVRTGVIKSLSNVVNNQVHKVNKGVYIPNIVATPVLFLHRKGSEAAERVHKAIFGQRFEYD